LQPKLNRRKPRWFLMGENIFMPLKLIYLTDITLQIPVIIFQISFAYQRKIEKTKRYFVSTNRKFDPLHSYHLRKAYGVTF
jgi:hypothetical protein